MIFIIPILIFFLHVIGIPQQSPHLPAQNEMKTSTPIGDSVTSQADLAPQSLESMLRQTDVKGTLPVGI